MLPVDIQDYFLEATRCLELNLTRGAVILAWAGFFHVLTEKMHETSAAKLHSVRQKWSFTDLSELKENYSEAQILEASKDIKFINRSEKRIYDGQLATRNQCAHPTLYRPSLNSAIGYVDEMIRQTRKYI